MFGGDAESALHIPGLVGVVLFYLLILVGGILAAWKTKTLTSNSRQDYMVAGRNMGLTLGTITLTGGKNGTVTFSCQKYGTGSGDSHTYMSKIWDWLWGQSHLHVKNMGLALGT